MASSASKKTRTLVVGDSSDSGSESSAPNSRSSSPERTHENREKSTSVEVEEIPPTKAAKQSGSRSKSQKSDSHSQYRDDLIEKIKALPITVHRFVQITSSSSLTTADKKDCLKHAIARVRETAADFETQEEADNFLEPFRMYLPPLRKRTAKVAFSESVVEPTSGEVSTKLVPTSTSSGARQATLEESDPSFVPSAPSIDYESFSLQANSDASNAACFTYHSEGGRWFKNSTTVPLFANAKVIEMKVYEGSRSGHNSWSRTFVLNPNSGEWKGIYNSLVRSLNDPNGDRITKEHKQDDYANKSYSR